MNQRLASLHHVGMTQDCTALNRLFYLPLFMRDVHAGRTATKQEDHSLSSTIPPRTSGLNVQLVKVYVYTRHECVHCRYISVLYNCILQEQIWKFVINYKGGGNAKLYRSAEKGYEMVWIVYILQKVRNISN